MEAIFNAKSDGKHCLYESVDDFAKYLMETEGEDLIVAIKPKAKTSEKMRMYAFYHGPVLHCAMIAYTAVGYQGVDKVVDDYMLCAEFAKALYQKPDGSYHPYILGRSDMTKNRFLKYLQDVLLFLEVEMKMRVPDSEEWKLKKFTGKDFRKV